MKILKGEVGIPIAIALSVATTVILGVSGFFWSANASLLSDINKQEDINNEQTAQISANTSTIVAIQARLDRIDKQLDRIESQVTGVPVSKLQNQ